MNKINFSASKAEALSLAAARTGLDDFGDPYFLNGYNRLMDELDDAGLSPEGAIAAREYIVSTLTSRLKAIAGFKSRPDAMTRPILKPLVITGIVRSGTTAIHKLLAMDPQFQGLEHWLCKAPQVRPPKEAWASNPDFQNAKATLDALIAIAPEVLEDHGMAIDTVEESLDIHAHTFHANMFPSQFDIPRYDHWWKDTDDRPAYRYLADVMRLVGAKEPLRRWLLKNPTDCFRLPDLVDVFPDAMIVQTHREPLQSVPSVVKLISGSHRMFRGEDAIDFSTIFAREQEMYALAMDKALEFNRAHPGRILHIEFNDFVKDQLGVIETVYNRFGLTLEPEVRTSMLGWLNENPRRSTTMQRFTPEDFGGNTPALLERFSAYRQARGY